MKSLYLQGIYNEVAGRRDQALADLSVLLESPAGIGEHGSISSEIRTRLEELSKYDGLVSSFDKYFRPREEPTSAPNAASNKNNPLPTEIPDKVMDEGE